MSPPNVTPAARSVMTAEDIDEVNRVFAAAFTDRYHRDGMIGVRVPELNPAIWRYAITAAGPGAMVWRDAAGIAAFNLAHANGVEGWMGPLAVRPNCQGLGLGRTIVVAAQEYLQRAGCQVIGLETMPRTIENIGFYSGLGFRPGHLTVSMVRDTEGVAPREGERLSRLDGAGTGRVQALVARLAPGLDFQREVAATLELALGDVIAVGEGAWRGLALWHLAPLSAGRAPNELRILKLVAEDRAAFRQVIEAALAEGARRGVGRVAVRCQTQFTEAYGDLLELGFRVQWTDLRMQLAPPPSRPASGPIVFSNWEI